MFRKLPKVLRSIGLGGPILLLKIFFFAIFLLSLVSIAPSPTQAGCGDYFTCNQEIERVKKELQVRNFGISNFDDPFNGDGSLAGFSWKKHLETKETKYVHDVLAHNRACVLKEYSLLFSLGFKTIEKSSCNDFFDGKNNLFFGYQEKL